VLHTNKLNSVPALLLSIQELRNEVTRHRLYGELRSLEDLHIFMQHHIFAVWDFMSLLKSVQSAIAGVNMPWRPNTNRLAVRLINEIVLSEECDEVCEGEYMSHFELYRAAMQEVGADVKPIDSFLELLDSGAPVAAALEQAKAPPVAQKFVATTWGFLESHSIVASTAALTLGREDILPEVFVRLIDEVNWDDTTAVRPSLLKKYLERHIYVDGEQHRPMAFRMLESVCQLPEQWIEAESTARKSLQARTELWDGVLECILTARASTNPELNH
jgi:hypothetical protein